MLTINNQIYNMSLADLGLKIYVETSQLLENIAGSRICLVFKC